VQFLSFVQESVTKEMDDRLTAVQPQGDTNLTNCFKYFADDFLVAKYIKTYVTLSSILPNFI
jgi:hypothetical protein